MKHLETRKLSAGEFTQLGMDYKGAIKKLGQLVYLLEGGAPIISGRDRDDIIGSLSDRDRVEIFRVLVRSLAGSIKQDVSKISLLMEVPEFITVKLRYCQKLIASWD